MYRIGIDLGGTNIVAGVVDTAKIETPIDASAKSALTKIIFQKGENK